MPEPIKSYVLRAGRLSPRQQSALENVLPDFELSSEEPFDFNRIFNRAADTIVEIGFGMGASLFTQASENPEHNFIGIEVHRAGLGSLAADLKDHQIENVRIAAQDAVSVLQNLIPPGSLSGIQIFFPDPWPKKRHHKRRLIQPAFIQLAASRLKPQGVLHCATDWEDYALQMMDVLSAEPLLLNSQPGGGFSPRPKSRPVTKFEKRGTGLGHGIWDLIFTRKIDLKF